MTRLLLATRNPDKAREIGRLLEGLSLRIATLEEFPGIPETLEDGRSVEENASKKALHAAGASGLWSLADDTVLEVAALAGAPGVFSARYAGERATYADNRAKLLRELKGVRAAARGAAFRTVMALAAPEGRVFLEEGRLEGRIAPRPRGTGGFGYDPVFYLPRLRRTLAELSLREKNAISHRGLALAAMRRRLELLAVEEACQTAGQGGGRVPAGSAAASSGAEPCPRCGAPPAPGSCRELCPECGFQVEC